MKLAIIGAGGIGGYFGAALTNAGNEVTFVARGAHLEAMREHGLHVSHPDLTFAQAVHATDVQGLCKEDVSVYDGLILLAKSMETQRIAHALQGWFATAARTPFVVSLQNGVENETVLCQALGSQHVIGGLTVKLSAHIVSPGVVEALGDAQIVIGPMEKTAKAHAFVEALSAAFTQSGVRVEKTEEIQKELWKKLLINNGVNALCALLEVKTGTLTHHPNLSQLVLGLMQETAQAARVLHVNLTGEDVEAMFHLIKTFES
ncbi:MAG: 2-dehydropantoate 2-reductase, partial [Campylobacterales bacterium]|nr:2-dehydropantoate 2-reductase [Campylobacterales bacterium]